jgi:drug/metabolite transporter (DMT)-like permease
MESQSDYSRIDKSTHIHWSLSTGLSLIFYCSGAYLLKEDPSPVLTKRLLLSLGYLICMVILSLMHLLTLRHQSGVCPSCWPESVFLSNKGLIPGFSLGVLGGVFLFLAEISYMWSWSLDRNDAGIIFLILMAAVPICSFFSHVVYKERFRMMQVLGILVALTGVILVGVVDVDSHTSAGLDPYYLGLSSMLFFSFRNLTAKALENKQVDVYTSGMLNSFGEVLSGLFLSAYLFISGEFHLISIKTLSILLTFSTLVAIGQFFFNQAMMTGNIGVVVTLFNLNGFGFLLLDYLLNSYLPELYTMLLCGVILGGILLMVLGDKLLDKYSSRNRNSIIEVF